MWVRVGSAADPAQEVVERRIESPVALVGRDPNAEILLEDSVVRRRQGLLVVIAGRVVWLDLERRRSQARSEAGVGDRLLRSQEWVEIGPYRLTAEVRPAESANSWPEPAAWPPGCQFPSSSRPLVHQLLPRLVLEFEGRSVRSSLWEMRNLVSLVGSAPGCKVRIQSTRVSGFECLLIRTPRGPWAVGLGGRGGLRERGKLSRFVPLLDGEPFEVGEWVITPRIEPPAGPLGEQAGGGLRRRDLSGPPVAVGPASTLVEQFSAMQADVLEQVRQSLWMMGRWLGQVHREEMDRIRAELAELRQALAARETTGVERRLEPPAADPAPSPTSDPPSRPRVSDEPIPDPSQGEDLHRLLVGRLEQLQRDQRRRWSRLVQRALGQDD